MPAEIYEGLAFEFQAERGGWGGDGEREHTNLKIMLIRQRILHRLNQRLIPQNLIRHLVHGILHTGTIILGKDPQGNIPRLSPGSIKPRHVRAHLIQIPKALPAPIRRDIGTQHTIPRLFQRGVLVAQEAPELRVCALEYRQAADTRGDIHAGGLGHVDLHGAGLLAALDEGVRVWLAVDGHAVPAVGDDVGMGGVDVRVCLDEVGGEDGAEELGGCDGVLFGEDVDGVFDGVCGDDDAVVCFGVPVHY